MTGGRMGRERERERGNVRSTHLEEALLRLVVDERDDPRAGGLDELDVGGADVGGGGAVADPAARAVPRVRDDADDGAVVRGGVRRRGARPRPRLPARQPDDPRRRRGEEGGQEEEDEQAWGARRVHWQDYWRAWATCDGPGRLKRRRGRQRSLSLHLSSWPDIFLLRLVRSVSSLNGVLLT